MCVCVCVCVNKSDLISSKNRCKHTPIGDN